MAIVNLIIKRDLMLNFSTE